MPSPGRHNAGPSSRSSSYRRQKSPERKRRTGPPSIGSESTARASSPPGQQEQRRKRKTSPRKASPDSIPRLHDVDERGSRLAAVPPRKMMRSVSPVREKIPLIDMDQSPPSARPYGRPTLSSSHRFPSVEASPPPVSRTYSGTTLPASRNYPEPAPASQSTARSYSTSKAKRAYGTTSTTFRRSTSEERPFPHTSALKRATVHMTSSRFGGLRDADDALLERDERVLLKTDALKSYVFNINNDSKNSRNAQGIVRDILRPESLQVVRRPAPASRETGSAYYDEDDCDGEELYHARAPTWTNSREGSRPIFDRDELIHQASGRPSREAVVHDRGARLRSRSPPIVQVARYIPSDRYHEDPRDSKNGQSHSRTVIARDELSHSRAGSSRDASARSREAFYEEGDRSYRSSHFEGGNHTKASRSSRRDEHDDLRHELQLRRDSSHHSADRARSRGRARDARAGSDSDLRVRINEKRTLTPERGHGRDRQEERSRSGRERHRSPPAERRPPSDSLERSRPHREDRHREDRPPERHHEEPEEYFEAPKPWLVDPEFVPRGRAYFEHDNRDNRGRGNMRMFPYRGRGMRLPFRGAPPPFHRGGYFVGPMIRGFRPPRGFIAYGPVRPYARVPMRRPYAGVPIRRPVVPPSRLPSSAPTPPAILAPPTTAKP